MTVAFVVFISFHFTKLSEIEKKLNGNEAEGTKVAANPSFHPLHSTFIQFIELNLVELKGMTAAAM